MMRNPNRLINRDWHDGQLACTITTSPRQRPRGTVTAVGDDRLDTIWSITAHHGRLVGELVGDYLDAERLLLDATTDQDRAEQKFVTDRLTRLLPKWKGRQ